MKLSLNNKTPILTEEDKPSWHCPTTCCFNDSHCGAWLCMCFNKQCTEEYSYTLQNKVHDIFNL